MRKFLLALFLSALFAASALGEAFRFTVSADLIRPGKMERISFSSPSAGSAKLVLLTENGDVYCVIREVFSISDGINHLTWDGTDASSEPVPAGSYAVSLSFNDETITYPVQIGAPSPQIQKVSAESTLAYGNSQWQVSVLASQAGTLNIRIKGNVFTDWVSIYTAPIDAGASTQAVSLIASDGSPFPAGQYTVQFSLADASGFLSTAQQISLIIADESIDESFPSPLPQSTAVPQQVAAPNARVIIPSGAMTQADEISYWTLPVGQMDEESLWEVMMQPMTVIDGNEKEVYRLRKTPDSSTKKDNIVGEITYASQGVHILETRDDGWTLVEAYNSSYGPKCTSRRGYGVTDELIQGYVKTSLLKTITPRTDYALLIDKMEQIMYIFSEGKVIGQLLVSTGLNNKKQSWNETPSGEFVMISRMGGFAAGNLWCAYGMRINGGCAIHEVPYIGTKDTPSEQRDYSSTVKLLGQKASHGCIRVQKTANEQGQNIKWLWDNIKVNTKVLIWDDTGRIRPYPVADDYELYYNPDGGRYYHENQNCPSVKSRFLPLTAFTYGELDSGKFNALTPCSKCTTLMKKSQIDALNQAEAGTK